jgi:hypothetical protein
MWTHGCVRAERKEDQILRMGIDAGGEIGGEWISAVQEAEFDTCSDGILNVWSSRYGTVSAT